MIALIPEHCELCGELVQVRHPSFNPDRTLCKMVCNHCEHVWWWRVPATAMKIIHEAESAARKRDALRAHQEQRPPKGPEVLPPFLTSPVPEGRVEWLT